MSELEEDENLLQLLSSPETDQVRNYDVFVFELCDGNISKRKDWFSKPRRTNKFTLAQSIDICKQLLEFLRQLEASEKCHNDLKPENILYKINREKFENGDAKITINIGDFGMVDRSGGTPGWTWPNFVEERKPGRSDMYSTALLILYTMCDSEQLFYRLRDNYIELDKSWLAEFRADPLIELVIDMMNLKPSVQECLDRWERISDYVCFLTEEDLSNEYAVPRSLLEIQDNFDQTALKTVDTTILDK